jgi:hypothetical protein
MAGVSAEAEADDEGVNPDAMTYEAGRLLTTSTRPTLNRLLLFARRL